MKSVPVTFVFDTSGNYFCYLQTYNTTIGQIDYNSIQDEEGNWKNYFQLIANDIDIVKFVEVQEDNKKSNNKYKKNFRK